MKSVGDEYFENGVCLIEWGELIEEALPKDFIFISFEKDKKDENLRLLRIKTFGNHFDSYLKNDNSNKNITIRKMNLLDLQNISKSLQTDFDNFWNLDILKEELQCSNSLYFVSIDESTNNILGFVGIKTIFNEADLMNIVIRKSSRNCGIATKLLNHVISEAKLLGITVIHLEVESNNYPAIKLYEKFGFKKVGTRKKYYGENDAILMDKGGLC